MCLSINTQKPQHTKPSTKRSTTNNTALNDDVHAVHTKELIHMSTVHCPFGANGNHGATLDVLSLPDYKRCKLVYSLHSHNHSRKAVIFTQQTDMA